MELMQRDGFPQQHAMEAGSFLLAGHGGERPFEAGQRVFGLTEPQQTQAASQLRLPAPRLKGKLSRESLCGIFEFRLPFEAQREIVMHGRVLRVHFRDLGVIVFRLGPLLLFEVEMAQAGPHFDRVFSTLRRAHQRLHGFVDMAFGSLRHGGRQARGGRGALRLSRV